MDKTVRLAALAVLTATAAWAQPSVATIIQRSLEATDRDWNAAPQYSYTERVRENGQSKTYDVEMLRGTPYRRLVAVNGRPLSASEANEEQRRRDEEDAARRGESAEAAAERIARYNRERRQEHLLIGELTKAFDFHLAGKQRLPQEECYVLQATRKKDYHPPNRDTRVLTGMQGTLWVGVKSYQWVKVVARVVHPVYIEGFLARVEPGTRFELERSPLADEIWLPTHFSVTANAKILSLVPHRRHENHVYSNYHKAESLLQ